RHDLNRQTTLEVADLLELLRLYFPCGNNIGHELLVLRLVERTVDVRLLVRVCLALVPTRGDEHLVPVDAVRADDGRDGVVVGEAPLPQQALQRGGERFTGQRPRGDDQWALRWDLADLTVANLNQRLRREPARHLLGE